MVESASGGGQVEHVPELRGLYLSGDTAAIVDSRTESGAREKLLAKPFTRAEPLRPARNALGGPRDASDAGGGGNDSGLNVRVW
jgi:hypothetical protein